MSMYAFASVLVVWVLFDYNMAFGEQWFPFLGKPALATSAMYTLGQATIPAAAAGMPPLAFPMATLIFFQVVPGATMVIILAAWFSAAELLTAVMTFSPGVDDSGLHEERYIWGGGWLRAGREHFLGRRSIPAAGTSGICGRRLLLSSQAE